MISVRNPLLRLNGNKFKSLLTIIILFSLLIACSTSKSAINSKSKTDKVESNKDETIVYNPVTKKYEKVAPKAKEEKLTEKKSPVDSVKTHIKKETPILKKPKVETPVMPVNLRASVHKKEYNVVYLLPFMTQGGGSNFENKNNSAWAIDFYSGAKLALEELVLADVSVNVHVIDSDITDEEIIKQLKRPELQKADLIIGPYKSSQARLVSDFVKDKNITVVSPYTASSKASSENANYIQVNPSILEHYIAICKHLHDHYNPAQIYILSKNAEADKNRANQLKQYYGDISGTGIKTQLKEIVLPDYFNLTGKFPLDSIIQLNDPTVFVVPSSDENFVQDVLRKLDRDRGGKNVVVIGMPQWQNFERLYDYFNNLNVTISSHVLIDPHNQAVLAFKQKYFESTYRFPSMDSFSGYDISKFFISELIENGTFFQGTLDNVPYTGLITNFRLKANISESQGHKIIDFFENKGINILEFKGLNFNLYEPK